MKRRATKCEDTEVQPGSSGDDLLPLQIVEKATPANPAAQEAIKELAAAKTPLELLDERVKAARRAIKLS